MQIKIGTKLEHADALIDILSSPITNRDIAVAAKSALFEGVSKEEVKSAITFILLRHALSPEISKRDHDICSNYIDILREKGLDEYMHATLTGPCMYDSAG